MLQLPTSTRETTTFEMELLVENVEMEHQLPSHFTTETRKKLWESKVFVYFVAVSYRKLKGTPCETCQTVLVRDFAISILDDLGSKFGHMLHFRFTFRWMGT